MPIPSAPRVLEVAAAAVVPEDEDLGVDEPTRVVALRNADDAERAPPVLPPRSPLEVIPPEPLVAKELVEVVDEDEELDEPPWPPR